MFVFLSDNKEENFPSRKTYNFFSMYLEEDYACSQVDCCKGVKNFSVHGFVEEEGKLTVGVNFIKLKVNPKVFLVC